METKQQSVGEEESKVVQKWQAEQEATREPIEMSESQASSAEKSPLGISEPAVKVFKQLVGEALSQNQKDLHTNLMFMDYVKNVLKKHDEGASGIPTYILSSEIRKYEDSQSPKSAPQPSQPENIVMSAKSTELFKTMIEQKLKEPFVASQNIAEDERFIDNVKSSLKKIDPQLEELPKAYVKKFVEDYSKEKKEENAPEPVPRNSSPTRGLHLNSQSEEIFKGVLKDYLKNNPGEQSLSTNPSLIALIKKKLEGVDNTIAYAPNTLVAKRIEAFLTEEKKEVESSFPKKVNESSEFLPEKLMLNPQATEVFNKMIEEKIRQQPDKISSISSDTEFIASSANKIKAQDGSVVLAPKILISKYIEDYIKNRPQGKKFDTQGFIQKFGEKKPAEIDKPPSESEIKYYLNNRQLSEAQITEELLKKMLQTIADKPESAKSNIINNQLAVVTKALNEAQPDKKEKANKIMFLLNYEVQKLIKPKEPIESPSFETPGRRDESESPTPRQAIRELQPTPQIVSPINDRSSLSSIDQEIISQLEDKPKLLQLQKQLNEKETTINSLNQELKIARDNINDYKNNISVLELNIEELNLQLKASKNQATSNIIEENTRLSKIIKDLEQYGSYNLKQEIENKESEIRCLLEEQEYLRKKIDEKSRENDKAFWQYQDNIKQIQEFYTKNNWSWQEEIEEIKEREEELLKKEIDLKELAYKQKLEKDELERSVQMLNGLKSGGKQRSSIEMIWLGILCFAAGIFINYYFPQA
ncbi:unnamed protein product [Blepharisma stoltei]|uniref:Viral A-type inclusion protein n=1 Tax=Blepharisma stoltei TaxID=1481888 RepID=A0AAU9JHX8_9CILI|nr:unnamed protein product [Blepharisma stoltei]